MKIKTTLILAALIGFLLSAITVYFNINSKIADYKQVIKSKNDTITYYQGQNNAIIAEIKAINITNKELKAIADELITNNFGLKKQVKNLNNLVSYLEAKLLVTYHDTITIYDTLLINGIDSSFVKKFNYNTTYLDFNGIIYPSYMDFNYTYLIDFTNVSYWKRTGFLKQKELVLDISFPDPNAKLISAQNIVIKPEPRKFYQKWWFWSITGIATGLLIK